ncbi:hypothetical protein HDU98_001681, partial [Podochytrium sp. JEL0797]
MRTNRPLPSPPPQLASLPVEIRIKIASFLRNPQHIARLSSTSRAMRFLWFEKTLWAALIAALDAQRVSEAKWSVDQEADGDDLSFDDLSFDDLDVESDPDFGASKSRPPLAPAPKTVSYLIELYKRATSTVCATSMNIIWSDNPQYWELTSEVAGVTTIPQPIATRRSEKVALLKAVCWFDVSCDLPNVRAGAIYVPKATIFVRRPFRTLENVMFSAEVLDSEGNTELLPSNTVNKVAMNIRGLVSNHAQASFPWVVVSLPKLWVGRMESDSDVNGFKTVRFRLQDHSAHWKNGLVLDSFELVKYEEPPAMETEQSGTVAEAFVQGASSLFSAAKGDFDLDKALKRALGGGVSGAAAMVVQVLTLMPLRTVMNFQYKNGMDSTAAIKFLYKDGGFRRYYRGLGPALIQGPLSRFGDTASNAGALALLQSSDLTRDLPMGVKTLFASAFAASFRMILTPIDTLKTTMQTSGALGTTLLRQRVKTYGIGTLWYGSVATAAATFVGHYPWFATYNMMQEYIPQQKTTGRKLARNAVIGFTASIVSDCISNSLRVIKTYRQTNETRVSYRQAVQEVVAKDGVKGLFGRGLKTRILTNGLQGIMFSVLWKLFE